jgi:hypothetical protein
MYFPTKDGAVGVGTEVNLMMDFFSLAANLKVLKM